MFRQFVKFSINGGLLGIVSWLMQSAIYRQLGGDSSTYYALATALTYAILVSVNFLIQRSWVFRDDGRFWRFVAANLVIMLLVSGLAPICRSAVSILIGQPWGDRLGFAMAALLGSVPSFLIKKRWVFGQRLFQPRTSIK